MSRRQLPKAYLRTDPDIDQHPDMDGLQKLICAANRQTHRGRFHDRETLRRILGGGDMVTAQGLLREARKALAKVRGSENLLERIAAFFDGDERVTAFLKPRRSGKTPDVIEQPDGTLYLDGWDEWQEGDLTVGERQDRIKRKRRSAVTSAVISALPEPLSGDAPAVTELRSSRSTASSALKSSNDTVCLGVGNSQSDVDDWISPASASFSEREQKAAGQSVPPSSRPACPTCGKSDYVRPANGTEYGWYCHSKPGGCGRNWSTAPQPKERSYAEWAADKNTTQSCPPPESAKALIREYERAARERAERAAS